MTSSVPARCQVRFDAQLRAGLRPAPELASVASSMVRSLRAAGGFNCLHVSQLDLEKNRGKIFGRAAQMMPPAQRTLFASDVLLSAVTRQLMGRHFSSPLFLVDLLPPSSRHWLEDATGRSTLALELVEINVCASAHIFVGNRYMPFSQAVCYERDGLRANPGGGSVASENDSNSLLPCADVYGREWPARNSFA